MKKLTALFLSFVLAFSFAACINSNTDTAKSADTASTALAAASYYKLLEYS